MTKKAPASVLIVGISPQIKYPNIIAKTKAKYFKGVTRETSEYLYDWLNHKFETPPKIPIKDNNIKYVKIKLYRQTPNNYNMVLNDSSWDNVDSKDYIIMKNDNYKISP